MVIGPKQSDALCSDECRTKEAFQYVKTMLPLFCAVVKYYYSVLTFCFIMKQDISRNSNILIYYLLFIIIYYLLFIIIYYLLFIIYYYLLFIIYYYLLFIIHYLLFIIIYYFSTARKSGNIS